MMVRLFDYWPLITYVSFMAIYIASALYVILYAPHIAVETVDGLRAFASWCRETAGSLRASLQYMFNQTGG